MPRAYARSTGSSAPPAPPSSNGRGNGAAPPTAGRTGDHLEEDDDDRPARHRAPVSSGRSGRSGRHHKRKPRSLGRTVAEWVGVIGGGIIIALLIEAFLVQAFWIPSPSMVSTLEVGDRVLVNKLSYRLHDVHRGDVVVFERPPGASSDDEDIKDLIKRVVAVGGDTIEGRNGLVYVNGERLDESDYLEPGTPTENLPRLTIPEGHVFVMGDNRTNSEDSRVFGPIDEDTIVGRAFIKVLPLGDIGWL
ncbi:MAG TPA: signal peptidase I [Acidimicrobiales bacterium]|nr:signal peptidase I [Acidimicrobiales bacterium]